MADADEHRNAQPFSGQGKAIVAGTSGTIGRCLAGFLAADGWDVTGLSRKPAPIPGVRTVAVDLADREACGQAMAEAGDATHIFYAARAPHVSGQPEPVSLNRLMLANLVEAASGDSLVHIHLVHGTKQYGSHLGAFKTPAREDDPRLPVENFYYDQQDYLEQSRPGRSWIWSISRPPRICDPQGGLARNFIFLLGIFAAVMKEKGEPLHFPGSEGNFKSLFQCVEAPYLARACIWMSTDPRARNHAFNVANGDLLRWSNLWPKLASYFGMEPGVPARLRLSQTMDSCEPAWNDVVRRHGLTTLPWRRQVDWLYGDFIFAPEYDVFSETVKLRLAGFCDAVDTEEMIFRHLDHFRAARLLP